MANYSTNYDEILKKSYDANANIKKQGQDAINAAYDSKKQIYNEQYNAAVEDANTEYEELYQKNAVQKLINEKQIAEKNSSLGLTNSGLNKTQQAAAQLGYSNQKGKIDQAKKNVLDTLALNLATTISGIEQSRNTELADWNYKIDSQAQNNAIEQYKTNVNANTKMYQADLDARTKAAEMNSKTYYFRGVSDTTGKYLYYNTKTEKTEEVPAYMNPYTSEDNRLTYADEFKNENIGFFQLADGTSGYQPRGLESEGGAFTAYKIGEKQLELDLYGNDNYLKVWYSPKGNYWVWDDRRNAYVNVNAQVNAYIKQGG